MKKTVKTLGVMGLAGCAVIASPFAWADDSGWYVGGNVGQSRAKIDDARIAAHLTGTGLVSITDDSRDVGYKLFGGYRINRHFAVETGYFDLGQFGFTATTALPGTLTGNIRLKGINIDTVGILPMTENFSVFGRIGLNYAETKDSFSGTVGVPMNPNPVKREANYKMGLGLQYGFTESLALRAEAERYRINDAVGNRGDIDLFSLGLIYQFDAKQPAPPPVARAAAPVPVAVAPAPRPVIAPPPPPPPAPRKVTFSADSTADALFSFGKAEVRPSGMQALDRFAADLKGASYEVIKVTGHTDRIGPHKYNLKLSAERAEAVKRYLVESAGIPAGKIETVGVNGAEPVTRPGECTGASRELVACLAPDRRVEVEVSATRTSK